MSSSRPPRDRGWRGLLAGVAALGLVGCGDGMARVTGVVKLGGEPVLKTETIRCEVTFKPTAGGPAATGSVDESGRFRAAIGSSASVPPGEYVASVRIREVTPSADPGGYAQSRSLAPERYASSAKSGLKYQLEPGSNDLLIEIPAN